MRGLSEGIFTVQWKVSFDLGIVFRQKLKGRFLVVRPCLKGFQSGFIVPKVAVMDNGHPAKITIEIIARRDGSGHSLVIRHYDKSGGQMYGGSFFCPFETTSKFPYGFDAVLRDFSKKAEFYFRPDTGDWKARQDAKDKS